MIDKRILTYSRQSKGLSLNPKRNIQIGHLDEKQNVQISSVRTLKGYEKTDGVLSYNIICVISGGEQKEKVFLHELVYQKNLNSLRVAFLSEEKQGLQPYQMQEKWVEIQKTRRFVIAGQEYYLDDMDQVYLLSDVDEFYDQLVKIIGEQSKSCKWIISNPCFEIWLYYCFKNEPDTDLADLKQLTVDKRSRKMKYLGHNTIQGGLNPLRAFERMKIGIINSLEHYKEDQYAIPILYATQMHEMAQYLIDTMNRNNNEFNEFVMQKRKWRKLMRK